MLLPTLARRVAHATTGTPLLLPASARWIGASASVQQQQPLALPNGPGLLEVREYTLHPAGSKGFLRLASEHAALRSQLLPFLGMFTCDTGGDLNTVTHLYAYADLEQRAAVRAAAAKHAGWQAFIDASRPHVARQASRIMVEAAPVYAALGHPGAAGIASLAQGGVGSPVYELRQYQLHAGYGSVPSLLSAFAEGLPHKVAADPDGQLVALAYSDVGVLNQVMELWRYPSAAASIRARQAARGVQAWRDAVAAVAGLTQTFTTSVLTPAPGVAAPWA